MKQTIRFIAVAVSMGIATGSTAQCLSIECPTDITVQSGKDCNAVVTYTEPVGADTCSPSLTFLFTNCGATGKSGPAQSQVDAAYTSTSLDGLVSVYGGIQRWVVPSTGTYTITAGGAQGAGSFGGMGARMQGDFMLTTGDSILILVGQKGQDFSSERNIGGGGGSYVINQNGNTILLIAGGGGASRGVYANTHGTVAINGQNGEYTGATVQGSGGINGAGGGGASCRGGGGAGWLSNGLPGGCGAPGGQGGITFLGGGFGGGYTTSGAEGGFGGGGSSEGTNAAWTYAGGGGGYSGGGGASETGTTARAGGGGSINNGINTVDSGGVVIGNGWVMIETHGTPVTTTQLAGLGTGATFPLGVTTETYAVSDGINVETCSFTITVTDDPATSIMPFSQNIICQDATPIALPLGTPVGGSYSGKGISGNMFDPSLSGIGVFWVVYADTVGCVLSDSTAITVVNCTGVAEHNELSVLTVSPNPGNGLYTIEVNGSVTGEVTVYDVQGKQVWSETTPARKVVVDLRDQQDGIYILQVKVNDEVKTKRLIKK